MHVRPVDVGRVCQPCSHLAVPPCENMRKVGHALGEQVVRTERRVDTAFLRNTFGLWISVRIHRFGGESGLFIASERPTHQFLDSAHPALSGSRTAQMGFLYGASSSGCASEGKP